MIDVGDNAKEIIVLLVTSATSIAVIWVKAQAAASAAGRAAREAEAPRAEAGPAAGPTPEGPTPEEHAAAGEPEPPADG